MKCLLRWLHYIEIVVGPSADRMQRYLPSTSMRYVTVTPATEKIIDIQSSQELDLTTQTSVIIISHCHLNYFTRSEEVTNLYY